MRKTNCILLLILVVFVGFSMSVFAEEASAPDKTEGNAESKTEPAMLQTVTAKLEQKPGLLRFNQESLYSLFLRNRCDLLKNIDKIKLILPEKLIDPIFGKITHADKIYYFVVTREVEKDRYSKLYFDTNADLNLKDETPVKPSLSVRTTESLNEYAYFEMVEIQVGMNKVGVHIKYSVSEYYQIGSDKLIHDEFFKYTICQQFTGELKIGKKEYKFSVVDQNADGKLDFDSTDYELWFIDVNCDGKYDYVYNSSEIVSSTEFMIGEDMFRAKFDIEKLQAEFTNIEPEFGKIILKIEDAKDACVYVKKNASHWGQQYKVEFKDGVGYAPIGKLLMRQLDFTKDGKRNKLFFRTYTPLEVIEISKDKPYELMLDLVFQIECYSNGIKNLKQQFIVSGYIYNRRRLKNVYMFTRVQLYQNDNEVPPCEFIIKDVQGNEVSKGTGFFSSNGRINYEFSITANKTKKHTVEMKYDYAPFSVEYSPIDFELK